jgi:hypothetical protein
MNFSLVDIFLLIIELSECVGVVVEPLFNFSTFIHHLRNYWVSLFVVNEDQWNLLCNVNALNFENGN